jgi:hypothetical protein
MESLLQKKYVQCRALWVFILREASSPGTYRLRVSDILDLAHILEKNSTLRATEVSQYVYCSLNGGIRQVLIERSIGAPD